MKAVISSLPSTVCFLARFKRLEHNVNAASMCFHMGEEEMWKSTGVCTFPRSLTARQISTDQGNPKRGIWSVESSSMFGFDTHPFGLLCRVNLHHYHQFCHLLTCTSTTMSMSSKRLMIFCFFFHSLDGRWGQKWVLFEQKLRKVKLR